MMLLCVNLCSILSQEIGHRGHLGVAVVVTELEHGQDNVPTLHPALEARAARVFLLRQCSVVVQKNVKVCAQFDSIFG